MAPNPSQAQEAPSAPQHRDHKNIYAALLQAKKDMGPIYKNASNPAYRSKYADLSQIVEVVEGPLQDNDILLTQPLSEENGKLYVGTVLYHIPTDTTHASRAEVISKDPTDPQKVGAAITYYRRYDLMAVLGLAPEDDDGNMAATPAARPEVAPAPRAQTTGNTSTPAPTQQRTSAPVAPSPAPSASTVKPGDPQCEVPTCKLTVWKSKEQANRADHDGHVICYKHDREDWRSLLSQAPAKTVADMPAAEVDSYFADDPGFVDPNSIPF